MNLSDLPKLDLRQMLAMTDDTGILQHATFSTPNPYHGYCTDDNARALIAAVMYAKLRGSAEIITPLQRYLSFLIYAFDPETGRFRNFMAYDRRWMERVGSEDSHARTVWALGYTVAHAPNDSVREMANRLFHDALRSARHFEHIRPRAFCVLGCSEYLSGGIDDGWVEEIRTDLAERLFEEWRQRSVEDWPWLEDVVTWGNGKLPQALMVAGHALNRQDMLESGLATLRWLLDVQTAEEGHLSIIGNDGWLVRGGRKARFDQQPLEAHALVHACLAAARITGQKRWIDEARRCFEWFLGRNDLGLSLVDPDTGGCFDGLNPLGVNLNQGAESTLASIISALELNLHHAAERSAVEVTSLEPVGYGLLGASSFGRFCLEQYAAMPGIQPLAVWNRTESTARRFADAFGIRHARTMEEMLSDPRIQLVHVAATPDMHARHAAAALHAGKHLLVEMPIATDTADAVELLELARLGDLRLSVDFCMRHGPLWEPVRRIVEGRALGAFLHGRVLNLSGDDQLTEDHWFWDRQKSGGIFVEHGVHFFDLFRSWLGASAVLNAHQSHRPGTVLVDQAECSVRYETQGVVGFYHGFHQAPVMDRQEIKLVFERGEVTLGGWVQRSILIYAGLDEDRIAEIEAILPDAKLTTLRTFGDGGRHVRRRGQREAIDRLITLKWTSPRRDVEVYGESLRDLMADLLRGIRDPHHRVRVRPEDGLAALEMATAATRLADGPEREPSNRSSRRERLEDRP